MSTSQKVVVVTGASQGIGAEVVKAFRKLDYRIVATARSIKPSDDANILTVAGDIGDPARPPCSSWETSCTWTAARAPVTKPLGHRKPVPFRISTAVTSFESSWTHVLHGSIFFV
jgi:NAD(P)-dependent dehydrogenase (short-subunit alcohol dehydrogenase family)